MLCVHVTALQEQQKKSMNFCPYAFLQIEGVERCAGALSLLQLGSEDSDQPALDNNSQR